MSSENATEIGKQLKETIFLTRDLETGDDVDANFHARLPIVMAELYRDDGSLGSALAGDNIVITSGGVLNTEAYQDPPAVDLLKVKLAADLAYNQPGRLGVDDEEGKGVANIIAGVRDAILNFSFDNPSEATAADKMTDATIQSLRDQGLLHLTKLEASNLYLTPAKPAT